MDEEGRADLLQRLFHLIGLEAEELGAIAIEGQGGEAELTSLSEVAQRARDLGEKVVIVADAIITLCAR